MGVDMNKKYLVYVMPDLENEPSDGMVCVAMYVMDTDDHNIIMEHIGLEFEITNGMGYGVVDLTNVEFNNTIIRKFDHRG